MEQSGGGKALGGLSALVALAAALLVGSVPAEVWNYSAEGGTLLIGTIGGAVAALLAWMARRGGGSALSSFGLVVGVLALAVGAAMLLFGNYGVQFG